MAEIVAYFLPMPVDVYDRISNIDFPRQILSSWQSSAIFCMYIFHRVHRCGTLNQYWWWDMTHGQLNVCCSYMYMQIKDKICPVSATTAMLVSISTNTHSLVQLRRCFHRVGMPRTKHPSRLFSGLPKRQKHGKEKENRYYTLIPVQRLRRICSIQSSGSMH